MSETLDDNLRAVPFVPFRCPRCGALKPFTYGLRGRVRYHKCNGCGTRFRSVEMTREECARFDAGPGSPPPRV